MLHGLLYWLIIGDLLVDNSWFFGFASEIKQQTTRQTYRKPPHTYAQTATNTPTTQASQSTTFSMTKPQEIKHSTIQNSGKKQQTIQPNNHTNQAHNQWTH